MSLFNNCLLRTMLAALEQIEKKDYSQKFLLLNLPIVKVEVNFDTETQNIDQWIEKKNN